ncbi:hypothetical protein N0V90_012406 [Kalmusia sp. IMI 367209]|nr:hypothetical protein N0V90_012406 [Kalmusia sp. IMI 367209]
MSRIHIQIGYDPLDDESRAEIWKNHFKKLENHERNGKRIDCSYGAKEFVAESRRLRELEWNGREIRNAFQTAVALACYEAKKNGNAVPRVTEEHFGQIVNMSTNFKKYMKSAIHNDYSTVAYQDSLRDDRFIATKA